VPVLLIAAISASGLSMLFSVGSAVATAGSSGPGEAHPAQNLPPEHDAEHRAGLHAEVRHFLPHTSPAGHPDFERFAGGVRVGLVDPVLGRDGLPTLGSRTGAEIGRAFTDAAGRAINPALFDADLSDRPGKLTDRVDPRVFSEDSFRTWFEGPADSTVTINLDRESGDDPFVFDSDRTPGLLPASAHTGVIRAELTAAPSQRLGLSSADDAWVFIDGRLAIDLGSAHARSMQWIDLDRLGLEPGRTVAVDVFFAERRSGDHHFRLESNARLRPAGHSHAKGEHQTPGFPG
jgi:fibro-slime domain-containing protein